MAEIENQIEDIVDKASYESIIDDQVGRMIENNSQNSRETIESRKRSHKDEESAKEKPELSFKR